MKKYERTTKEEVEAEQFLPPLNIPEGVFNVYQYSNKKFMGQVINIRGERVVVKERDFLIKENGHVNRFRIMDEQTFKDQFKEVY